MASNKHKGSLSLQQVLDSNLNDDPENDLSEEESSEEEVRVLINFANLI